MTMLLAISLCLVSSLSANQPKIMHLSAYPKLMVYAGISGQIELDISVDENGNVVSVVSTTKENDKNKALVRHASLLMKKWRFFNSEGLKKTFKFKVDYILLPEESEDDDHYEIDQNGILKIFSKRKVIKDIDKFH